MSNIQNVLIFLSIWLSLNVFESNQISKILLQIQFYLLGSIFLIYSDQYFIGVTYIIIYCGAIAILFLFALLISPNLKMESKNQNFLDIRQIFILLCLSKLFISKISEIDSTNWLNFQGLTDLDNIIVILFNGYPLYFVIMGLFLFLLLIGILELLS